jgi:hypothetical protein
MPAQVQHRTQEQPYIRQDTQPTRTVFQGQWRVSVHDTSARYHKHRRIEGAHVLQRIALHGQ